MKVAAYQAPLHATRSTEIALGLIREQVERCELVGVEILCCPEGVLGGLADYAARPAEIAIDAEAGELDALLAPLASDRVATIVGFTEIGPGGRLYNAAAVYHRGSVAGIYRKLHPAIRRSVYAAGDETPVFTVGGLTFGIVICRDSNFPEPARIMASQGAAALFVPTNNGLPPSVAGAEVATDARNADIARAAENGVSVVRADVAGRCGSLESWGSSGIVDHRGVALRSARRHCPELLVADIEITSRDPRRVGA
ncbi:MAG TPA: carbon-nitrogen hydrolase family protein [Longimicrobium sp.]|jgi:predicted amidohydrolase|nr:carbon-nitrogen hydrolase family protein [Longimicrobium sp.]